MSEALACHFWKTLNKDSQFAQMVILSDQLKEEDFHSARKLRTKLEILLDNCQNSPVSASAAKVQQMLEYLQTTYERAVVCGNVAGLQVTKAPGFECDLKELDAAQIVSGAMYQEMAATPVYARMEDPSKFNRFNDVGRRRGRPRKYPLPGMSRDYLDMDDTPAKLKGEDDNSMIECGICGEPGDLICCEVCPSVYHLHCLELGQVPKGKWMCFFCRIVKDGLTEAMKEKSVFSDDLMRLIQPADGWQTQALQILDILMMHPCSKDLKAAEPKTDFPPEDLTSLRHMVTEGREYGDLEAVEAQIRKIWKHTHKTCKRNSTLYYQVFNLQLFHNKIDSELQELLGPPQISELANNQMEEPDPVKIPKIS